MIDPKSTVTPPQKRTKYRSKKVVLVDGKSVEVTVKSPKKMDAKAYREWREQKTREEEERQRKEEEKNMTAQQRLDRATGNSPQTKEEEVANRDSMDKAESADTSREKRDTERPRLSKKEKAMKRKERSDLHNIRKTVRMVHTMSLTEEYERVERAQRKRVNGKGGRCLAEPYQKAISIDVKYFRSTSTVLIPGRVCIVDTDQKTIYDRIIQPTEPIFDYCTSYTGLEEKDMEKAVPLHQIREEVRQIADGKLIVGHRLRRHLEAIGLTVSLGSLRDVSDFEPLRCNAGAQRRPSLEFLIRKIFKEKNYVRRGGEEPYDDALQSMRLYLQYRDQWENDRLDPLTLIDTRECPCCGRVPYWMV